jgi:hypothetical protein
MATGKITVKRVELNTVKKWTIHLNNRSIGYVLFQPDGDWTGRVTTMSEEHFNSALELVSAEIAEEVILMELT